MLYDNLITKKAANKLTAFFILGGIKLLLASLRYLEEIR